MLIRRAADTPARAMTMDGVRDVTLRVLVGREDGAPNFAMRQIRVEPGGNTPRHQHNYEHEVYVLSGRGSAEHAGQKHPIEAGDVLYIEANALHQFVADADEALEFLCLVPVSFDCGGGDAAPVPGS